VLAALGKDGLYGHLVKVVFGIFLHLLAVGVEGLVEIAFAVEQADPGQGYARSLAALR